MDSLLRNVRVEEVSYLDPPSVIRHELPIQSHHMDTVRTTRNDVEQILHGTSTKILVVMGPCSIHDPKGAIEYGHFRALTNHFFGIHFVSLIYW